MKVVVVGAGLAGLRTADHLARAGCAVELIEAGNRPGGRARTVRDRFTGGQYAALAQVPFLEAMKNRPLEITLPGKRRGTTPEVEEAVKPAEPSAEWLLVPRAA